MKGILFEIILLLLNILTFIFNWKIQHYGLACMNMFVIGVIFSFLIVLIKEEILG